MESAPSTTEEHIEYVELLDSDVYDNENTSELIEIHADTNTDDGDGIMHEIIAITDDSMLENYEEIQYVEAEEEVSENTLINPENQTIFIHDGRKYVISNDQLTSGNHTIILDEQDGQLIQQDEPEERIEHIEENDESQMYYTSDIETEVDDTSNQYVGRQYAVLKDGKLHLTNIQDGRDTEIRQFESTLTNYEEQDEDVAETENNDDDDDNDDNNEEDKQLSEITGKNLITGQTISLSGILEKMRRKTNVNDLLNINLKQQRNTASNPPQPQDYILVPPVTRRVVVGRTQDGKRLVGRILQIQKKIQPNDIKINQSSQNTFSIAMPTKRPIKPKKREPQQQQINKRKENEKKSNQIMQLRYVSRSVLDDNVARTLAGLMDLESINKRLKGRRLIVRHIQRRSREGKIIAGSKKVAYYCGRLKRQNAADNWTFVQEYPAKGFDENGIDLPDDVDNNSDKVNVRLSDDGRSVLCNADAESPQLDECELNEETLTLYLTETQDEFGKKKTRVTIPQFVGAAHQTKPTVSDEYLCKFCGKRFQSVASLKRHATVHDHSLRPLQCLTCLGRFTDESSLKKHMILHTGLRPHKCHLCDKSFAHRGDLNFHLRTHDPVKRYECTVCKKQFNRHSNMLRHAEIHRPFNNKTTDVVVVAAHESIITINEEEYNEPETETETETGKTAPFTCDQCGIQYNFSSSLTRHIVNVHLKQTDVS